VEHSKLSDHYLPNGLETDERTKEVKRNRNVIMAIALTLFVAACAHTGTLYPSGADQDFINNWYKTLYAEAMTVDATMTTLGVFYKAGKLSEADKTKAVAAHVQFKTAFDDAIAKLITHYNEPSDASRTAANNACINVEIQMAAITAISILTSSK
jgi:hypothetical protein